MDRRAGSGFSGNTTMTSTVAPSGSSGALISRRWPGRTVVSIRNADCMTITFLAWRHSLKVRDITKPPLWNRLYCNRFLDKDRTSMTPVRAETEGGVFLSILASGVSSVVGEDDGKNKEVR